MFNPVGYPDTQTAFVKIFGVIYRLTTTDSKQRRDGSSKNADHLTYWLRDPDMNLPACFQIKTVSTDNVVTNG